MRDVLGFSTLDSFICLSKLRSKLAAEYFPGGVERPGVWGSGRFAIALTRLSFSFTSSVYISHTTEGGSSTGMTGSGLV